MRRYEILVFCNKDIRNPAAGGGTWELFRLMRVLVKRGHIVTLVCGNYPGGKRKEVIEGIKVIRVGGMYTAFLHLMLTYLRSKELRNCDLIVDVALMGIPFFTPLYTRKPIVAIYWHLQKKLFFMEFTHKIRKTFGYIATSIAYFIEDGLAPVVYRRVPLITFSNSSQIELMETGFKRVTLIEYALARAIMHSAINENSINQLSSLFKPGRKNPSPLVIYLGRLKIFKGVQDAIKAMLFVVKEIPDARLLIVGRGDYETPLKILTKRLSLEETVDFVGYISVEEKIKILQKAHVLVMPSYKEGFSTPVFEANMCGTTAIVSSAVGVRDSVIHGETGFVYRVGNVMEMAKYIKILLKDSQLREKMQMNALKRISKVDWKGNEEKLLELLEEKLSLSNT